MDSPTTAPLVNNLATHGHDGPLVHPRYCHPVGHDERAGCVTFIVDAQSTQGVAATQLHLPGQLPHHKVRMPVAVDVGDPAPDRRLTYARTTEAHLAVSHGGRIELRSGKVCIVERLVAAEGSSNWATSASSASLNFRWTCPPRYCCSTRSSAAPSSVPAGERQVSLDVLHGVVAGTGVGDTAHDSECAFGGRSSTRPVR